MSKFFLVLYRLWKNHAKRLETCIIFSYIMEVMFFGVFVCLSVFAITPKLMKASFVNFYVGGPN